MRKRTLIINTGGTISSIKTSNGYTPITGYVKSVLEKIPCLKSNSMPDYVIKEYDPLLDSSNISIESWNKIGTDIKNEYQYYDGFVILHGTDTMSYTASILSFMLENLGKPVIITGSQIPLLEFKSDAINNIITSIFFSSIQFIYEVCIYFNRYLLRGNRTKKISTYCFNAFKSPNFSCLAFVGMSVRFYKELLLPQPKKKFKLQKLNSKLIVSFRLFPGISIDILGKLLQYPLQGLILETYGSGNAQNNNFQFLKILKKACKSGILIVNCSQCVQGCVNMNQYLTGYWLKKLGLINGWDLTLEAAYCKLLYLLNKNLSVKIIKKMMVSNLCGELSVPC
ncbi:L-asparaginase 1 [Candidatus Legionella polyplacis]|uniref:asparaginase n=1 Tax=Candidatus Legionella polyplacis TaxID=2005262 RepID=A0ABZ2GW98_9GAMM|nr:asparaginase [Candidatus Legionella polyplacis]ATW01906.1 L-asparaginase 1 [Candidatus Legionella polyplacis]